MNMTAAQKTINRLIDDGWRVSHSALVNLYRFSGTISPMQTRKGVEYCRVHHGQCVGTHSYQITTVMSRPVGQDDWRMNLQRSV